MCEQGNQPDYAHIGFSMNKDMKAVWVQVVNGACADILAGRATLQEMEGVLNVAINALGEASVMKMASVKKVQKMHSK